jgi:hypothetical protein
MKNLCAAALAMICGWRAALSRVRRPEVRECWIRTGARRALHAPEMATTALG